MELLVLGNISALEIQMVIMSLLIYRALTLLYTTVYKQQDISIAQSSPHQHQRNPSTYLSGSWTRPMHSFTHHKHL